MRRGRGGLLLQLLSQPADVHVDRACSAAVRIPPDPAQDLLPREDAPAVPHQVGEEVELARAEPDVATLAAHGAPIEVQSDAAHPERPLALRRRAFRALHA